MSAKSPLRTASPAAPLPAWAWFGLMLVVALTVYAPALRGGFIWDDDNHVTGPGLRSLGGLFRIWFEPGATQQFYPLLHSAFWVEHGLWGDAAAGYHLVNVVLHAVAATMFGVLLRRLSVPGAWLAAWLFLLHPVCVESVAWISEQKNTLSLVLYLAAALAYLRFERERRPAAYAVATGVFMLALLTKTVTATLPGALLVVFWWQRGRLEGRRDILPLLPWFVLGAVAGLFTARVERVLLGADGAGYALGLDDRIVLSGRVIWFYLGKLVWPADLMFFYPRWTVDAGAGWQWLFTVAFVALLGGLWWFSRRARGPLAVALLFGGSLFPVLGFFNIFPFVYSYVADHFQSLASLAVFALVAAGLSKLPRPVALGLGVGLSLGLGFLSWRQAGMYCDVFTLYETTLRRNPSCWMAHNNLAIALVEAGREEESLAHYEAALKLRPDYAKGEHNYGFALNRLGRYAEALPHLERAVMLKPDFASAHNELGAALMCTGRPAEGVMHFEVALRLDPDFGLAHRNLGLALAISDRVAEALPHFEQAVRLLPKDMEAQLQLALALASEHRYDEAKKRLEAALEIDPGSAQAHLQLAAVLHEIGHASEAEAHYRESVRLDPKIAR